MFNYIVLGTTIIQQKFNTSSLQHNEIEFKSAHVILHTAWDLVEQGFSDFFAGLPLNET